MVVLLDPVDDDILRHNRSRERQFMFDAVMDSAATQVSIAIQYSPATFSYAYLGNQSD